jgi:hypothetical protein
LPTSPTSDTATSSSTPRPNSGNDQIRSSAGGTCAIGDHHHEGEPKPQHLPLHLTG